MINRNALAWFVLLFCFLRRHQANSLSKSYLVAFCLILVATAGNVHGQNQKVIDSLENKAALAIGADRFAALYKLTFQFIRVDNERALETISRAEAAALLTRDSLSIARSKRVRGHILYFLERHEDAWQVLEDAYRIALRNGFDREERLITTVFAGMSMYAGRYDEALRYFFRALDLANLEKDSIAICQALQNVGFAYYKLMNYPKALEHYEKALHFSGRDSTERTFIKPTIALCYAYLGRLGDARRLMQEAEKACGICNGRPRLHLEYASGVVAREEKDFAAAELHFQTAYEMALKEEDTRFQLDNLYSLMDLYIEQNRELEVLMLLKDTERLIERNPPFNLELIKVYSSIYKFYLHNHDFRNASIYQSRYIDLRDSIFNESLISSLMKIEAAHTERENRAHIVAQEELIRLKDEMIANQDMVNLLIGLFALMMTLFAMFLFRSFRMKKYMNEILEKKVEERTRELHTASNHLSLSLKEHEELINRMCLNIREAVGSLEGLCLTAMEEQAEASLKDYFVEVRKVSGQLGRSVPTTVDLR